MTIAATGFMHIHLRSKNKANFMGIWFEKMKMPPLDEQMFRKAAQAKPLLSADWQALQYPTLTAENPEAGKFRWDGKFVANPALSGKWQTVALVPSMEAFGPAKSADAGRAPFKEIDFNKDGKTNSPLYYWSGDTLIDMEKLQALKITAKGDLIFIEAGGFNGKNPVGWKPQIIVMKKSQN